jgi:hypothetical protein
MPLFMLYEILLYRCLNAHVLGFKGFLDSSGSFDCWGDDFIG